VTLSAQAATAWQRIRRSAPGVDHIAKALARYWNDSCDRLAAGVTYYGFLSLFPLLLLIASVTGYLLRNQGTRQERFFEFLNDYIPSALAQRLVQIVSEHAGTTGLLGLLGLLIAGLGWVDALRESLREVWHQPSPSGSILRKKLLDVVILIGLGLTALVSLGVSAVATRLATLGYEFFDISPEQVAARTALQVLAFALAVLSDVALLTYLLLRLPRTAEPFLRVVQAAFVGALLLEVAKYLGFFYFGAVLTRSANVYGTSLATALGLLLWVNLMARFMMFTAAWAVTAPYRYDVPPSGSAGRPDDKDSAVTGSTGS
jgi:membrane protein